MFNRILFVVIFFVVSISFVDADNWAVLVAGSNGYYNYRHQADVCHAFHVLHDPSKGNFPADKIIVLMYDDIANNEQNPIPGNIINHPNGTNVYVGVNKDYTGEAVTPSNFLAILSGNSSGVVGGNGKVLETGPDDNIFVYFSDHGATGLVAFPNDYLYASDLMNTLKYMFENKKYKNLVFYLEACESGSMFNDLLPDNMNIFATTASTPTQSSYACYYDTSRSTYLGDEYSVRWMEDSDVHNAPKSSWTLEQQFRLVALETVQSQPQQYGDTSIASKSLEDFQGIDNGETKNILTPSPKVTPCNNPADSRDVKLQSLMNTFKHTQDVKLQEQLNTQIQQELFERGWEDFKIDAILQQVVGGRYKNYMKTTRNRPKNFDCLKQTISHYENKCGKLTDYSLKWVYVFVNLCEEGISLHSIQKGINQVCQI